MEKSHCHCCLLVTSGRESPYQFLFKLGRILFTTTCFHCCWVISMWAAESQAVLTFSMQFLIKNCAWRRCDILSFTVKEIGLITPVAITECIFPCTFC